MQAVALSPQVGLAPRTWRLPRFERLRNIVRQSRRHGLWIFAWSIVGWVGTGLAPVLADKPFLLMMLSPRALFVAMASDSVSLVPFVLLGTLRLSVTDASYFIIGRTVPGNFGTSRAAPTTRWRQRLASIARRGDRVCRWFCARPRLAGAFLFFRPNGKYLGLAGAYGVNRWVAAASATLGTAAFLAAVHVGVATVL